MSNRQTLLKDEIYVRKSLIQAKPNNTINELCVSPLPTIQLADTMESNKS